MLKRSRALITALAWLTTAAITAATITHKVIRGETAYSISNRYGIDIETLYKYNPQTREGVKAGEILVLPDNGTAKPQQLAPEVNKTYHTIQKGESLFGISKRYGMTVDQLLALNPQVDAEGYTAGTVLRLRKDTAIPAATAPNPATETASEPEADDTEVVDDTQIDTEVIENPEPEPQARHLATVVQSAADQTPSVVIMLPLMSDTPATKDKVAQHSTDFIRGFLIAADTLSHKGYNLDIKIYDTYNNVDSVRSIMQRPEVKSASVIITPSDTMQLQSIASLAEYGSWIFNIYAVKDETFMNNTRVIQGNIPHDEMYGKAINAFISRYKGMTPVFIANNNEAKNDKAAFTNMLRSQLQAEGQQWLDINYNIAMTEKFLSELDPAGSYVFIPASSSKSEFNHFAATIKKFGEDNPDATIRLFGYPEWVTFKGSARELLGDLNATIYSRFFLDELDYNAMKLNKQFFTKYGREMLEVYPSQAVLGYDLGTYVIKALRGDYKNDKFGQPSTGIQTPISLDYDAMTGPVNTAIYIITFTPGGFAEKTVM